LASSKPPSVRQQDAQGGIVATLDDYSAVRDRVVVAIAEGVEATVSPTVRETVTAVQGLPGEGRTEAAARDRQGARPRRQRDLAAHQKGIAGLSPLASMPWYADQQSQWQRVVRRAQATPPTVQ